MRLVLLAGLEGVFIETIQQLVLQTWPHWLPHRFSQFILWIVFNIFQRKPPWLSVTELPCVLVFLFQRPRTSHRAPRKGKTATRKAKFCFLVLLQLSLLFWWSSLYLCWVLVRFMEFLPAISRVHSGKEFWVDGRPSVRSKVFLFAGK